MREPNLEEIEDYKSENESPEHKRTVYSVIGFLIVFSIVLYYLQ